MKIVPLYDRVLVEETDNSTTTTSGLVLSSAAPYVKAKVVDVGTGHKYNSQIYTDTLSVGDTVILPTFKVGMDVGNHQYLVRISDILAIVQED